MRNYDLDEPRTAIDFPSAEYDQWKTTPDDEEDPRYRTEFDDRVQVMADADLRERSREPEEDRLRRLKEMLARADPSKSVWDRIRERQEQRLAEVLQEAKRKTG